MLLCQVNLAQEPCSEIKVAVIFDVIDEDLYEFHQSQYAADTKPEDRLPGFTNWMMKDDWMNAVYDYLLNFLQESNPDVNFVLENGDYELGFTIYKGYVVRGKLSEDNACGFSHRLIKDKLEEHKDLFQAIKNLIGFHFDQINRTLINHELKYPTPVRGPKIEANKSRDYLSPLFDDRKLDIQTIIYNCKWENVYDRKKAQSEVFYPLNTERTKSKSTQNWPQNTLSYGDYLKLGIKTNKGASATFGLVKGTDPSIEEFEIYTCGRDRKETKTIKININGLDIQVKPKKTEVQSSEKTSIDIYFNTVSPNGNKRPVVGKQLTLSVKGIVDGSVSPSKTVTTDSKGKATLQYKAGKKEEKITITASYQPVKYPDVVTGSSHINIISKEYAWNGSLSLEVNRSFQCNEEEQISELSRCEVRANDEITQKVNLTISMDDFDLALQPAIPATHLIVDASGEMYYLFNEDHFTADRAVKTWCFSKKWISPGSWNTRHETWSGQADRQIKKENINLLITKDIELNKEAMQDLQKQMQEAAKNNDMAAIQELKGQMVGMVQGNQDNNTIPIRIRIEIVFDITEKDILKKTWEYKGDDVCLETDDRNESGTNTIELPIAQPVVAEMKGTYTRGKDGRDIITANINKTETSQSDFYKEICPDVITTINGQINLERQRK